MNRVLDSTVRHIAKQSTGAIGRSMRLEASFRLRECRPRPHLGSSPAGFSASSTSRAPATASCARTGPSSRASRARPRSSRACPAAGLSGASGRYRTTATDGSATCGAPSRGPARAHAALRPARGGPRVRTPNTTDMSALPRSSASPGGWSGSPGSCRRGGWWRFSHGSWSHIERGGMPPGRLSSDVECHLRGGGYLG